MDGLNRAIPPFFIVRNLVSQVVWVEVTFTKIGKDPSAIQSMYGTLPKTNVAPENRLPQ